MKVSRPAYALGLKLEDLKGKRILVAFSGGLDSCVLLELLLELKSRLDFDLGIAHIHHGDETTVHQKKYRDKALAFSKKQAEFIKCPFFFEKFSGQILNPKEQQTKNASSEANLRKVRSVLLEKLRSENQFDILVLAHHAQDLFETRLIRLIRGTGQKGLESMRSQSATKLRPLLEMWPEQIRAYADQKKIEYLKDPSNQDHQYLRNWIRTSWLVELEAKRPGSTQAFARSLELLANVKSDSQDAILQSNQASFNRDTFRSFSKKEQQVTIAECLRKFAKQNYSSNMVQEICKRLDTPRKELSFKVAGFEWTANAALILVREII